MFSKLLDIVLIIVDFKSQSRSSGARPTSDGHCRCILQCLLKIICSSDNKNSSSLIHFFIK